MSMNEFLVAVYIVIGIVLSSYWYYKEYDSDYKSMIEDGIEVEKGMVCILILCMTIFWPIKLLKNLILKKRI